MKALIQRVIKANVVVENKVVGEIKKGLLMFVGIERTDKQYNAEVLLNKIINYRIFPDNENKMNNSLSVIQGELLIVSQFTLVAETNKGLRPSFSSAANPQLSLDLYKYLVKKAQETSLKIQTGIFAADMQISLINDGPVTFNLQC